MLSKKQQYIFAFPMTSYDALICDGSIRSGKTTCMMVSFIDWAMENFDNQNFIIGGRTISSIRRNVIEPYLGLTYARKRYTINFRVGNSTLVVKQKGKTNRFILFGGYDSRTYQAVQGFTAAGCFIDEVVLCDQMFVNQCIARCSVKGSKYWFNCNPEGPEHWFKKEWIDRAKELNALYIHFNLRDNPALDKEIIERYERQYTGVFYDRYILGMWTQADGLIYPMYKESLEKRYEGNGPYCISIDYGTLNATAALKWRYDGNVWHCIDEYYYSGKDEGHQKTDDDYVNDMVAFTSDSASNSVEVIVDPSAASFITALRRCEKRDFKVIPASNAVIDGIRDTATCMKLGLIKISDGCAYLKKELAGYVWDSKRSYDIPVKENDHACDAMRYFVYTKRVYNPKTPYISPFNKPV